MQSATNRFNRRDLAFLVVAALLVLFYIGKAGGGFPLDDSWIHQVYGRNLAQTGEWAFVPGVPSAASTSPLYTVLLSIGYRLNIPFKFWTFGLGILTLWIAGMVGARMADRILPQQTAIGCLIGLTLMLSWHLLWAAASGMETMLFSMWTLVIIALAWREADSYKLPSVESESLSKSPIVDSSRNTLVSGVIFGALAALATLTRPEGVVLAGLVGLSMLIVRPQPTWRRFFLWAIGAVAAFSIVIAPYIILNYRLTGGLLPNTAAAKQAESADLLAESFLVRLIDMLIPLFAGAQLFLIPGIIYFAAVVIRQIRAERKKLFDLLPLAWAIVLVLLYTARLPAYYQHGRYVIPAIPSLILIGMVGTFSLVELGRRSAAGRVLTRSLALSSMLAFIGFALVIGPNQYARDVSVIDEEMVASAHWIADHIPPGQLLAVHDIGAVGYFAPRPILDLAGLVSPEIIPFIKDKDRLWTWLSQSGARYLMAFPDQLPGGSVDDPHLCPLFTTGGAAAIAAGGGNMTIYTLTWDGICPKN